MLVKLGRYQIPEFWREIKATVISSIPKELRKIQSIPNKVLEELLTGHMEAWIVHQIDGNRATPVGYIITSILEEPISRKLSLQLYAASMKEPWSEEVWRMLFYLGSKYARSRGCETFSAYTSVRAFIEAATKFNIPTETHYIVIPVEEEAKWADQVDPRAKLIIPTT